MIRTKIFLILLALIIPIGPRYHEPKKGIIVLNKYEEARLISAYENSYKPLKFEQIKLPEPEPEPEPIPLRDQVLELIAQGKYILTGFCSCQNCKGSFGGRKAKGLPEDIEIEGDTPPGTINLGRYIMIKGVRHKVLDDGTLVEYPDIDIYCGEYVECKCKACDGSHDYFLIRR